MKGGEGVSIFREAKVWFVYQFVKLVGRCTQLLNIDLLICLPVLFLCGDGSQPVIFWWLMINVFGRKTNSVGRKLILSDWSNVQLNTGVRVMERSAVSVSLKIIGSFVYVNTYE